MSKKKRNKNGTAVPPGAVVLDCQAFALAVADDRRFAAHVKIARAEGRPFAVSALTILEAAKGKTNLPELLHYLSTTHVQEVTREDAVKGVELLGEKLHGHKYAIDAAVAAMTIRIQAHRILTSDVDDMMKLLAGTGIEVGGI